MEPRIGIQGKADAVTRPCGGGIRFNGAPDRNPGKDLHQGKGSIGYECFNGAPDRNPGKAAFRFRASSAPTSFN